jgi:hypothetical protein
MLYVGIEEAENDGYIEMEESKRTSIELIKKYFKICGGEHSKCKRSDEWSW